MYDDTSIIKNVNPLSKFICYLLVIVMLFLIKDNLFLLFVDIFFLLVTKNYRKVFIYNIIITGIITINFFYPHVMWIIKILLLVLYTILLKKVTKLKDLKYILELTLYKLNNKKLTYKVSYLIYYFKNIKKHFNKMLILKDDYEMKLNIKLLIFIFKQSLIKSKLKKEDFIEINKYRFYNHDKKRTYVDKITWESWDTNYLLCHLIILVIIIVYGR